MTSTFTDIIEDVTHKIEELGHAIAEIVIEPKYIAGYKDAKLKFLSENLFLVHTVDLKENERVTSVTKMSDGLIVACITSEEGHFLYKIDTVAREGTSKVKLPYSNQDRDIYVTKLSSSIILLTPFEGKNVDVWDLDKDAIIFSTQEHQGEIYTTNAPIDVLIVNESVFMTGDDHEIRLWDLNEQKLIKRLERRKEELPRGMIKMNELLVELYSSELDVWDLKEGIVLYRVPIKENLSSLASVGPYVCALRVEKLLTQVFVFDPADEFRMKKTVEVLLNAEEKPPRLVPIHNTQVALVGDEGIHVIDVSNDHLIKEWTVLAHFGKNITDEFVVRKNFVLDGERLLMIHGSVVSRDFGHIMMKDTLVLFPFNDIKLHYDIQETDTKLTCLTHL
jgi:hypothetical protein